MRLKSKRKIISYLFIICNNFNYIILNTLFKKRSHIIVIDFKFAKPTAAHRTQVQNYIGLLNSMGHPKVKGYLWYVFSNNIVEVS